MANHDIGGLYITVAHMAALHVAQRLKQLHKKLTQRLLGPGIRPAILRQGGTLQILHHEVHRVILFKGTVPLYDVRVFQGTEQISLFSEVTPGPIKRFAVATKDNSPAGIPDYEI